MASFSDEIISAIKYALDKYKVGCDQTFQSVVTDVKSNGHYIIRANDGTARDVKCAIPNATLRPGSSVWVTIPSGNFNQMFISGII